MTDEDLDDFLGPAVPKATEPVKPAPKKRGRPPKSAAKPAAEKAPAPGGAVTPDSVILQGLQRPVSVNFLAQAFRMDRTVASRKLAPLPPVDTTHGGHPLYNFLQAAQYLVKPQVDPVEVVKRLTAGDLPASLQKDVWDARLKQQKWALNAGDLWPTDAVLETLGDAFQRLKTTTQLWIDQISEARALPPEVRKELTGLVDGLNRDLHDALVRMPAERQTRSQLADIEGGDLDV